MFGKYDRTLKYWQGKIVPNHLHFNAAHGQNCISMNFMGFLEMFRRGSQSIDFFHLSLIER